MSAKSATAKSTSLSIQQAQAAYRERGQFKVVARSRITNGSVLLPGVDGRSTWARRCRDVLAAHLSDVPDASAAERSIIRRAATLTVELERLEKKFALANEASPEDLDIYQRVASALRRLLETVGLQRRQRAVLPNPEHYHAGSLEHYDAGAVVEHRNED